MSECTLKFGADEHEEAVMAVNAGLYWAVLDGFADTLLDAYRLAVRAKDAKRAEVLLDVVDLFKDALIENEVVIGDIFEPPPIDADEAATEG